MGSHRSQHRLRKVSAEKQRDLRPEFGWKKEWVYLAVEKQGSWSTDCARACGLTCPRPTPRKLPEDASWKTLTQVRSERRVSSLWICGVLKFADGVTWWALQGSWVRFASGSVTGAFLFVGNKQRELNLSFFPNGSVPAQLREDGLLESWSPVASLRAACDQFRCSPFDRIGARHPGIPALTGSYIAPFDFQSAGSRTTHCSNVHAGDMSLILASGPTTGTSYSRRTGLRHCAHRDAEPQYDQKVNNKLGRILWETAYRNANSCNQINRVRLVDTEASGGSTATEVLESLEKERGPLVELARL